MNKIKVIVVDDELHVLEDTIRNLKRIDEIEIAAAFTSPVKALKFAQENVFAIAILDIEMQGISGIDLAELLIQGNSKLQIIFTTGYDSYALQAYHLHAIEYLIKPFSFPDLQKAIERAKAIVIGMEKEEKKEEVHVRTFGKFDVYIDQKALFFSYSKAKELFALLIDARGGTVSMDQAITCLWMDKTYDNKVKQLYRKTVSIMRNTFKKEGYEDICFYYRSCLAVNVKKVSCDYYSFLEGDEQSRKLYLQNCIPEYEWAEETNAMLANLLK